MKNKSLIITVVACVVVGAAAFFGGIQYQKMQRTQFSASGATGRFARASGAPGQNGAAPVRGQIISADSTSITVKMQDGSSKIVVLPGNVNVMESTTASKQALTQGQTVMVFGTTNSDGSVTAQNVQINPQAGGFGGGRPGGSPRPQSSQAPY